MPLNKRRRRAADRNFYRRPASEVEAKFSNFQEAKAEAFGYLQGWVVGPEARVSKRVAA